MIKRTTCFIRYPKVDPPEILTKLALALYTGIKEKTAKIATSAQMVLSPLICFSISFNVYFVIPAKTGIFYISYFYKLLTAFLN
jgi:hypothetical protein